jgi:hypothetical protein
VSSRIEAVNLLLQPSLGSSLLEAARSVAAMPSRLSSAKHLTIPSRSVSPKNGAQCTLALVGIS